jgi:hypothetical protein
VEGATSADNVVTINAISQPIVSESTSQVVFTTTLGNVNGTQNVTIDTQSLTSGVYMVNLSVDGAVSTQKLVVRK